MYQINHIIVINKHLLLYSFIFLLISCSYSYNDNQYFNGEVRFINDTVSIQTIVNKKIEIEGIYDGPIFVYDSLMIYYPLTRSAKNLYDIYNIKNDSLVGNFFRKGNGPNEFAALTIITDFFKENNDLKTLLYAGFDKKLITWNISKSIEKQTTIIDTIMPFDWETDHHTTIYNTVFRITKDTVLAMVPATAITLDQQSVSLPLIEKRKISDNKCIKSYNIYTQYPEGNGQNVFSPYNHLSPERFLTSFYNIKPDQTKLVQALMFLPQINIIDLNTGTIKGFRFADSYNFSIFKKHIEKVDYCFTNVVCDNQYIYALYSGINITDKENAGHAHLIYVFNWDGELIKKFDLGINANHLFLDHSNNRLYAREYTSDYTYCYTLGK